MTNTHLAIALVFKENVQVKNKMISIRLSEEEFNKLKTDANTAKMSESQYIRKLITGNVLKADNGRQELVRQVSDCMR